MDAETEMEYPLKSLHDFLNELDKEWDRFRKAALIGVVTSFLLLLFLGYRFVGLLLRIRRLGIIPFIDEFFFNVLVAFFVIYEIYLLLGQYRFFGRWERRIGLLLHLEERLMGDAEGKDDETL